MLTKGEGVTYSWEGTHYVCGAHLNPSTEPQSESDNTARALVCVPVPVVAPEEMARAIIAALRRAERAKPRTGRRALARRKEVERRRAEFGLVPPDNAP